MLPKNARIQPLLLVIAILIMALPACGSNAQLPSSNTRVPTGITPPQPVATIATGGLPETSAGIAVLAFSLSAGKTDNGWKSYQAYLAFRNLGSESVLVMNADIKDQPSWFGTVNMNAVNMNSVWMDTSESFVETSEGKTYPAVIGAVFDSERLAWNGFPLPRNLAVTGVELLRLVVTYKVPELLHPTRLVLNPGILHQNEQVEQLSLDLGNVSQDFSLNDTAANSLPANIQVSSSVQVNIDFSSTGQITNTLGNQFTFRLDMSLTNTDITSDQPVALRLLVVDDSGRIYSHVYDTLCRPIPFQVGPGQTVTTGVCFTLPEYAAHGSREFYLVVIGDGVDEIYSMQVQSFTNCVGASALPNSIEAGGYTFTVQEETQFNIPGSISGTFNGNDNPALRLGFQGVAGKTIDIDVKPTSPGWRIAVADPSGTVMLRTDNVYQESASQLTGMHLLCDGQYSIYLMPTRDAQDYMVTVTTR